MQTIEIMSENLANKISAGEVVERIANVVKELVENSIDAKANEIKIELIDSGLKSIKVVDNGTGMSEEDAKKSFLRHATSKIKNENDLFFINTLGFRGEALAAISAVSETIIDTYDEDKATKIHIKAGKLEKVSTGSLKKGTTIEIKKLFFNTPARLKFLKSLNTELALVTSTIEKISLSHPEISFTLINDEKTLIKTSGSNDLFKTIHEIYGYNVSKNMIAIYGENYDYTIDGYISNINVTKSTRSNMITIVNKRVVNNPQINKCIKDAYHTVLSENRYPITIINIDVDPTMIDVNIHPTKQDIKVSKIDSLTDLLFDTIRNKLVETDNMLISNINSNEEGKIYSEKTPSFEVSERNIESYRIDLNEEEELTKESENVFIKPVGLALGTYLIAEDEDIMYLIDIHAANERINYEKIMKALEEEKTSTIEMLFPFNIELSKKEYLIIKENLPFLESLGFKVEEFGINTFRVSSHPTWIKEGYEVDSIKTIFDILCEFTGSFDRVKFSEKAAITLACKSSVKANTNIGINEREELINKLFKCEFPYTCPHGRPTIIKYPRYELEKIFKRVG